MTKPANPAVILGLGGTGQWVLTYVKKNLIDTYGEVPPTVKLLSFDTTSAKTEAKVEKGEEHARVGNVQLEAGEFVYLGGNIRNLADEIKRDGKHPHIGSWFQAEQYLVSLPDDAWELAKGAGQRRPFGRMAVFYDLTQSPSQIIGKLEQAITEVKVKNETNQPIEIYVVCSLAGGTGSGMFIDIAHIARKMAERLHVGFAVRAFLVLQNTFQPVIDINHILANSFAATRELDRFHQVFDRDYPIYYAGDQAHREPLTVYRSIYRSKLFDNCYLLDARRNNLPLDGVKPWLGVFPSVAECITALLDPETGDTFAQHYKNVNNQLALHQQKLGQALYSSLGTYTYILPVEDIAETAVHRAAVELLRDHLFRIVEDPHTRAPRVTSEGQKELRDVPRDAAMSFLKSDKLPSGAPNLPFLQQMALTLEGGSLSDGQYIADMAQRGVDLLSWLASVETDDAINKVSESIDGIVQASLNAEVMTSDVVKDDWHSGAERIDREIRGFREKKLGYEEAGGRRVPGELQKGLAEFAYRNRRRFRQALCEKIAGLLNGESSDPITAKSGKLPYAQEFLGWLIKAFDEFDGFMRSVRTYRDSTGEVGQAREDEGRTKGIMYDTRDLTGVLDRMKKTAVHAQEDYIAASDFLFTLEREDVLYRAVMDYTAMFRAIAEDAKARLDAWADVLTLGGAVDSGEPGAYVLLAGQQAQLKRRRDEQRSIRVYQYLTDDKYEDELYKRLMSEKWGDVLRRLKWEVGLAHTTEDRHTAEEGQVPYRHKWEKDREPDFIVQFLYGGEPLTPTHVRQDSASNLNARFLVDHLRPYFLDVRHESIADRLKELKTAEGVAKELLDNAGALIQFPAERQPALEKHNFVCVNRGVQVGYFNELAEGLRKSAPNDKDNQVIGLTNRHRCLVLSTVDLIVGRETAPIITSQRAYTEHVGDHRLLHNFPAEVNAGWYEDRITRPPIGEDRRLLSPTLVALLEDREMMRRYVMARVFGLLCEEPAIGDPAKNQWILRLDRENGDDINFAIRLTPPGERPAELDAMTEFVFVEIDPNSGQRRIKDVTPGRNIGVEPRRVDGAIALRQTAILKGREAVVERFDRMLAEYELLLNRDEPQSRPILVGAFRKFMVEDYDRYDRDLKLGDLEPLSRYVESLLDENRDCCTRDSSRERAEALRRELVDRIVALLKDVAPGIKPQPKDVLVRLLRDYVDASVRPMRDDKDPRTRQPNSQLTKDLGAVIHLVLWDEIQRLERQFKN